MQTTSTSLLERLQDRLDSAAWQRLVSLYSPCIHSWLRRYALQASDAEDVVQEVLGVVARRLPEFRHNQRPGAFRAWLRAITVNCLRSFVRYRQHHPPAPGATDLASDLDRLEDPDSDLSRLWDLEHDRHVAARLLELVKPEFTAYTWQAFHRQALEGVPAGAVAAELGISVNAVHIAKSRVLGRLRTEARELLDETHFS
jgi:RNA polymerase sigma-70 factor (ECF subfamily)